MLVIRATDAIKAPFSTRAGAEPRDFPGSLAEIDNLTVASLNQILNELSVRVLGGTNAAEKRRILKQCCGIMRT